MLSTASTASEPVKVRTRFDGRSIAFLASTGPGMGTARIRLNGRTVATVDLERSTSRDRAVVWARNFRKTKRRTIAVKALAPDKRVEVDGFVFLR